MNTPKEIEGIRFLGLEKLDEERLAIKSLINKSIIGAFFGLFLLLGAIGSENLLSTTLILGVLIYCFRRLFFRYKRFIAEFKTQVINTIVQEFGFHFRADRGLSIADFLSVYDTGPATFRSEDLIFGEFNQTEVEICDFSAFNMELREKTVKSLGIKNFQGILFKATFPKELVHWVYVCDKKESGLRKEGEIALMDNPSFNRYFDVFTEDQILARYALSPKLMERFCGLKEKFNCPISMVLRDREVIIAVNLGKNSFEPSFEKSLLEDNTIRDYISSIKGFTDMVKELGLNSHIWK